MKQIRTVTRVVIVGAVLFMLSGGAEAAPAQIVDCQPSVVSVDGTTASARLKINCKDGNWYYTNPGGTCATAGIEMVKVWESMAMTALLSGKKLNLYFDAACGNRTIFNMDVTN